MLEDSISAISSSLVGNVAISIIAATVAGVSAWLLGLPFPIVLAVDHRLPRPDPAGRRDHRRDHPRRGRAHREHEAAIITLIIQLVYQQLEN